MAELTRRDLHWFRLANAAPAEGFYPFKDRFLRRFGVPEGWDLQVIALECHGCGGSGWYARGVECNRCNGSGVYSIREHWLQRWRLLIRHEPMSFYWVLVAGLKRRAMWCRAQLAWRLIRVRNRMDLFKSVPEEEDVPF